EVAFMPPEGRARPCHPLSEVRHARQSVELNSSRQRDGYSIKQGTENRRSGLLEIPPKILLRATTMLGERRQRQTDGAVHQIGPACQLRDAVDHLRPTHLDYEFLAVCVELPSRETAARCNAAESIRQPSGNSR